MASSRLLQYSGLCCHQRMDYTCNKKNTLIAKLHDAISFYDYLPNFEEMMTNFNQLVQCVQVANRGPSSVHMSRGHLLWRAVSIALFDPIVQRTEPSRDAQCVFSQSVASAQQMLAPNVYNMSDLILLHHTCTCT